MPPSRLLLMGALTVLALSVPVLAQDPALSLAEGIARDVSPRLKALGISSLSVLEPTGPQTPFPDAIPSKVQNLLGSAFQTLGFKVASQAPDNVKVDYSQLKFTPDSRSPQGKVCVEMRIEVTVIRLADGRPRRLDGIELVVSDRALLEGLLIGRREPETDKVLGDLARQVAKTAAEKKITRLHVKPLQGPSGAGVKYALRLSELLRDPANGGLQVDSGAKLGLQGRFYLTGTTPPTFVAQLDLVDENGVPIQSFQSGQPVDATEPEVLIALGATAAGATPTLPEVPPAVPPPQVGLPTIARAESRSPYGIELLVNGQPHPVEVVDGRPVLKLPERTAYVIRLVNDSDFDAAVLLSIDGLSAFQFMEGKSADVPIHYIIRPKSSTLLKGWYRNTHQVDEFQVVRSNGPLNNAPPAGAGQGGSITAIFHAAWAVNGKTPADESARGDGRTDRGLTQQQEAAVVQRIIGKKQRAVVTVHYSVKDGN